MNEDLFLHLAEIGGVYVGFGALISLRSTEAREPHARGYLRGIVWMGSIVVLTALLPVLITGYGLAAHPLWVACGVVTAVAWVFAVVMINRAPDLSGEYEARHRAYGFAFMSIGLPLHLTIGATLLVIFLGVAPAVEPTLYATAVTAILAFATWTLVMLVWDPLPPKRARKAAAVRARRPAPTSASSSATADHAARQPGHTTRRPGSSARRVRAMTAGRTAGGAR